MPYKMPDGRIIDSDTLNNLNKPHAGFRSATYLEMLDPSDIQFLSQMNRFGFLQPMPQQQAPTKTTADLFAEQSARNNAINQQKNLFDAQQANQFSGYFNFLNKPMEISPFQLQNGQAVMGRPTYGGQPPMQNNAGSLSSLYRQGNSFPGMTTPQVQPQVDLGQMYQLFSNPYLAQLASLLFANSSWLK